jgi:transposase
MDGCPSNLPIEEQSFRRIEVLTGTPRRRRWSTEEKAAIVAASLAEGAVARQVALRYGVHPNQLYAWRRELAADGSNNSNQDAGFVPVAVARSSVGGPRAGPAIEIALGAAVVRVAPGVEMGFLSLVLRAVKLA